MSEGLRLLQVDAFADRAFRGNPAAVCFLEERRDDAWLLAVAAEMNLSETAFLLRDGEGFELRWFTPAVEVPLCGHATLASAHAIWEEGLANGALAFSTRSGRLTAEREDDWIRLDFPAKPPQSAACPAGLAAALGAEPVMHAMVPGFHLVEVADAATVRALDPDLRGLAALGDVAVIATAAGDAERECDFVSRVFGPGIGIDEDPVTGAAHCILAPFWSARLGRRELVGYQASARGGIVRVRMPDQPQAAGRVHLLGRAVTTLRGHLVA